MHEVDNNSCMPAGVEMTIGCHDDNDDWMAGTSSDDLHMHGGLVIRTYVLQTLYSVMTVIASSMHSIWQHKFYDTL